jgi:hypothetical protein
VYIQKQMKHTTRLAARGIGQHTHTNENLYNCRLST